MSRHVEAEGRWKVLLDEGQKKKKLLPHNFNTLVSSQCLLDQELCKLGFYASFQYTPSCFYGLVEFTAVSRNEEDLEVFLHYGHPVFAFVG